MIIRVVNYISFPNYLLIITNVIYFETCFRNIFKENKITKFKYYFKLPFNAFFLILKFHER